MTIEWFLYLVDLIKNIDMALGILFWSLFFIVPFALSISYVISKTNGEWRKEDSLWLKIEVFKKKYFVKYCILVFSILFVSVIIPSEKTMYMILGAHYLKQSTLPAKVENAIEKKLDEYLHEEKK